MKVRLLVKRIWALLLLTIVMTGCGGDKPEAPAAYVMDEVEHERWEIALVEMRIEKNESFLNPDSSPLPASRRDGFEGLNYYFPEPGLRFESPFVAVEGAELVQLTKREGQAVQYLRRGTVTFKHEGKVHTLAVFGPADKTAAGGLWLPFYDASNGQETYGGGRYLDIEVDGEGRVDLDFNYAYNPLCNYDPQRNCTLPPAENTLDFAVNAGEKIFGETH